jgi:copine 5/8/9
VFRKEDGNHTPLGSAKFLLHELMESKQDLVFKNPTTGKLEGKIGIKHLEFKEKYSFLDFIFCGVEINLMVAIDFTLSNGDPSHPDSLHYFNQRMQRILLFLLNLASNQYLQALKCVGPLLENYSRNKMIPVLGFGAKIKNLCQERSSQCFALNGDIFNPEVYRIEGVIEGVFNPISSCDNFLAYRKALPKVQVDSPQNLSKIIKYVNDVAELQMEQIKIKYFNISFD